MSNSETVEEMLNEIITMTLFEQHEPGIYDCSIAALAYKALIDSNLEVDDETEVTSCLNHHGTKHGIDFLE
jgi:hypothetical protein